MELKQLRYFLCVADTGSFSRAAVQLSVAQPILSRQIQALEHELSAELFYRNGRGVVLSEAGKLLDGYAKEILGTADRAEVEIASMRLAPQGKLTIAMPPSLGWVLTVPLVHRCRREFPMIALHVVEGFSGYVTEWLATGRVNIGIIYNAPRVPTLLMEPLLEERLVLLGPADDPAGAGPGSARAERLADIPLILPARPHGLRMLIDRTLERIGVVANVQMELDAMTSTLALVESGAGYTILCDAAVRHLVGAGRIRSWPIEAPAMYRRLMLATSTQRPTCVATRTVAKLIRQQVGELFGLEPRMTAA
ncbi:MAG TPA: LysR substrate-binding domain-containing protein [Acetobacteraceae bacterium]|nr:LysR substrate-binding domain-containing protein [Acetobacteraceae bacterium]